VPGNERDDAPLVQVYATASLTDGHLAKGLLESDGIRVWDKGPGPGDPYPTGATLLFVAERDEERARQLLRQARAGGIEGVGDPAADPGAD
jgi:hypothetical protein